MIKEEHYYDVVIAPELERIAHDCNDHGMSVVFVVEIDKENIGETRLLFDGHTERIKTISEHITKLSKSGCHSAIKVTENFFWRVVCFGHL